LAVVNGAKKKMIDALTSFTPGAVAVGGKCDASMSLPGLYINGLGNVSVPLNLLQAKAVSTKFKKTMFGTNTTEILSDQFQLQNPSWNTNIHDLTKQICKQLGIDVVNINIEAQLSKMYLFEKGSCFKPRHHESNNANTFGSLVVTLPSHFDAGACVVEHGGEVESFDCSNNSKYSSHYHAFYKECTHELQVVTSGHCLCVVYELVKVGSGKIPRALNNKAKVETIRSAIKRWGDYAATEGGGSKEGLK